MLPDVYIYSLRKKSIPLSERTVKYGIWQWNLLVKYGSIANSQRMLIEINKSRAIAKTGIWVESDTVKH